MPRKILSLWLHLRQKQTNKIQNIRRQMSLQFAFLFHKYEDPYQKHAHARTLTEATNKSPIFSLLSHSATRDASAIWNMEWHCVISLIRWNIGRIFLGLRMRGSASINGLWYSWWDCERKLGCYCCWYVHVYGYVRVCMYICVCRQVLKMNQQSTFP